MSERIETVPVYKNGQMMRVNGSDADRYVAQGWSRDRQSASHAAARESDTKDEPKREPKR